MTSDTPIAKFEDEHFFLSNFYPCEVSFPHRGGMITFPSSEHAFQACKYRSMLKKDDDERLAYLNLVKDAATPSASKYAGKSVAINSEHWDSIKVECMREIVFYKFKQNPELIEKLLATGAGMLVEGNTWNDSFWGRVDGKGKNIFGSILMEIRGYFLWKERAQ